MGGSDDPTNLVSLTVEEHAQAHLDLYNKYRKEEDLIAHRMLSGLISVEEARRLATIESNKNRVFTPEILENYRKAQLGKVLSEETKEKIRAYRHTPEAIAKIIAANKLKKGMKRSPKSKERMRLSQLGKKHSEETREKMRMSAIRRYSGVQS